MFKGGRPTDQLRLRGNRQSGGKTVVRCKLCNLHIITHGFVVISKHCTFTSTLLQVLKSSFTFYSSTFFTKYFYFDSSSFEVNYFYLTTKLK